ncbi:FAD-binding oxidoreductase [Micromonospora sp. 067-2]|uniref:FAD-binding oxidoreductase n=1 Tax=Micromonospora sp. 067-2 TaxID=2789270 RepID=UPI0039780DF9
MTMDALGQLAHLLHQRLPGDRVSRPGDLAYDSAVDLWNGAVVTRPARVVRPRDAQETSVAVTAACQCGIGLSVRAGGHDVAGRALCDGGLVIDLGAMRDMQIVNGDAVAGGGVRAADVVAAAAPHGLNVATGTAGVVGMAGLSLGGGYGPLLGTAGLAADNLLWAEVVLADGRVVHTEDEPELLWALRGGGGNFGVVTRMGIRLHRDRGLVGGMIIFPWEEADAVLARYADVIAQAPDELTLLIEMTVASQIGPCLLAVPVWSGEPHLAQATLDRVLRLGSPLSSTIGPARQKDLLQQFDQQVPRGMHWEIRTRSIAALTPDIIDVLIAGANTRPGPGAGIGLRQFHGAATRVDAEATAFGLRTPHIVLEISAGRAPHEDAAPFRDWVEAVSADLALYALPGGYPNFLAPDQNEQVVHAYGPNTTRLLDVKQRYDPRGVFTATPLPIRTQENSR